ncbi:hypothetical protein M2454_000169 [Aequitasia blattaphilus]|uniref:DUF4317 domain-containing protein n=1 Tax=Aequitasia blattaphilus TaxID=2949332 RepID=A0ABT1E530_9FIRM|nr:DUF4317 domain-containing protein [Aequitasia blattaphilus]MCP1100951.1 DUF4317 domain-containing protein [Aequitasia blattaphilus]MCR8613591.1 DUF4317 domain-containing protein [Aequitasia blattaphilus]
MKKGRKINREDMLELTRRMTTTRNCFTRIAGAYFDEEGYIDGTFNTSFLKLSPKEKNKNLEIAKAIPFSETNVQLIGYQFEKEDEKTGSLWQMLMALKECELKNDGLLDVFYEVMGERYSLKGPFAIYLFYGNYDVPMKAKDGERLDESEEVYSFIICGICPFHGDYELDPPKKGFLFPAFVDRSSDIHGIGIYKE